MFKRILALYIEQKWWVLTVTLLIFVSRGITLLIPYLFGLTTDAIIRHEPINVPVVLSLWQLALEGVNRLIQVVRQRVDQEHVWFPIQERLRFQTLGNYLKFSIGQLKQTPVGMSKEILSSGENSMMQIGQLLVRRLAPMTVQFLAIAGLLFWQNYRLALVVVGGLTLYGIAQRFMERKYTPLIALRRDKNLTSYNTRGEILSAATLIKAYSKEGFAEERYKKDYLASIETSKEVNRYINKYDTLIAFLINVTQVGAFLYGLHMVYSGQITFGYLTTISVWCAQMCNMINVLGDEYQGFLDNLSNVRKFFELIDTPPMIREIPDPVTPDQIAGFIQLKQVTFIYPPRKRFGDEKEKKGDSKGGDKPKKRKKVLDEVSLSVEAGSRVAIVGPSGEGKSTLVSLIQRAYDPTSGVVEIDGVNIRNLNLREFCRHIGVVDQGSLTINLSIRENVALGSQNPMTDEEIIECCRLAQLDVFSFDDGLDTIVGDMGSGISGGERQRIAIARAIASDPRILIFDEPTSSLDAMTEAKIKETIKKVSKGRTTIIIAHRLSTIQDCDKIFVMEKGRITASGTHTDLLDSSHTYRQFAEEQRIAI